MKSKLTLKKAAFAANISFMVSAFWHGFYPIYYIVFILFFMIQQSAKTIYNAGDSFNFIPKGIQHLIRWVYMTLIVNTLLVGFALLELDKVYAYAHSILYFPYISIIAMYVLLLFFGPTKRKRKD